MDDTPQNRPEGEFAPTSIVTSTSPVFCPASNAPDLEAENFRLREALRKYGRHLPSCIYDKVEYANKEKVCDCGFDAAKGETK